MVPTLRLLHLLRQGVIMLLSTVNMHFSFAGILGAMLMRIFEMAYLAVVIVLLIVDRTLEGYGRIVGHYFYIVVHQPTIDVDVIFLSYFFHGALGALADQAFLFLGGFVAAAIA